MSWSTSAWADPPHVACPEPRTVPCPEPRTVPVRPDKLGAVISFSCASSGHSEPTGDPRSSWQVAGFVASSHIVLVVEEGDGWVKRSEDDIEAFVGPHVVAWEPGEWVEYGSLRGMSERNYFGPRERSEGWHPSGDPGP
jgi:hypothetical protein